MVCCGGMNTLMKFGNVFTNKNNALVIALTNRDHTSTGALALKHCPSCGAKQ